MRAGGEADKLAGQYEGLWTIRCLTRVLAGDAGGLELEPLVDPIGIEFVLHTGNKREHHSVKRNAPGSGAWTLGKLCNAHPETGRSVLEDLTRRIQRGDEHAAVFVSMSSADLLRTLTEDIRGQADTLDEFRARLSLNAGLTKDYDRLRDRYGGDDRHWFDLLSRLQVVTISQSQLIALVEHTLGSQVTATTGETDTSTVRAMLWQWLVTERLGSLTSADDIWQHLREHGYHPHRLAGTSSVALRQRAIERLAAARRSQGLTRRPVTLRLRIRSTNGAAAMIPSDGLAHLVRTRSPVALSGDGGAGKSWLLLSTAVDLLADPTSIPVVVPAADWAMQGGALVRFACGELDTDEPTITEQADRGVLVWLIDGWNELPADFVREAEAQLRTLMRRFPRAACLLTTRGAEALPPLPNITEVVAEPLSDAERRKIIEESGATDPQSFAGRLERTPDLDELTRTPLFLAAALAVAEKGRPLPSSVHSLLAEFVDITEHRRLTELRAATKGQHRRYLEGLAASLAMRGTTRLRHDDAIATAARCSGELHEARIIGQVPDAEAVLRCLIAHHLIVSSPSSSGAIGFAHQRFQEWFAAEHLERHYSTTLAGGTSAPNAAEFQAVLNRVEWYESALIFAERLHAEQRHGESATFIKLARSVDIALATAITGRSSDRAWNDAEEVIHPVLTSLVEDWDERVREYALSLMAMTRRPTFADIFWRFLRTPEGADSNERAWACEAVGAFGLDVLGEDWQVRFEALPPQARAAAVMSIGMRGDHTIAHLIIHVVDADSSAEVRAAAIRTLLWHGYVSEACRWLLRSLPELAAEHHLSGVWEWIPADALEPLISWLQQAWRHLSQDHDRMRVLSILHELGDPHAAASLRELANHAATTSPNIAQILASSDPDAWLELAVQRLRDRPERVDHWLPDSLQLHRAQVSRLLVATLREDFPAHRLGKVLAVALRADETGTIKQLAEVIRRGVANRSVTVAESGGPEWDQDVFNELTLDVRARAMLAAHPDPASPTSLSFLLRCLVPWGYKGTLEARALHPDVRDGLRALALGWLGSVSRWPERSVGLRADLALLIAALSEGHDASLVTRLIEEDRDDAREVLTRSGRRRTDSCNNQYIDALVRLGSDSARDALLRLAHDPEYVGEACRGLANLALKPEDAEPWPQPTRRTTEPAPRQHAAGRLMLDALLQVLDSRASPREPPYGHDLGAAVKAIARLNAAAAYQAIDRVIDTPGAEWGVLDALESLARSDHVVPVDQAKRTTHWFTGELQRNGGHHCWYPIRRGIWVLFFSSQPGEGVKIARELATWIGRTHRMCELVETLGAVGTAAAADVMIEWYDNPDLQQRCARQFFEAFGRHPSPAGDARLLAALGTAPDDSHDRSALIEACRKRMEDPGFRRSLLDRVMSENAEERSAVAEVVELLHGDDVARAACVLLDDERFGLGWYCIEEAFTGREPVGSAGSYRLLPRSCPEVRGLLFEMYSSDRQRTESARHLLIRIEKSRLELGRPEDEPLHPRWLPIDVTPWPQPIRWPVEPTPLSEG